MRHWTLALLVAVGFSALAQKGEELSPRISIPGERALPKKLEVTEADKTRWRLTSEDKKTVDAKVAELNKQRADLLDQLEQARQRLEKARQDVRQTVERLRAQQDELYATIKPMLPADQRANFDLRVQLQPIIDWLDLSEDKAADLVRARRELITEYGGPQDNPATRIRQAATEDVTPENRADYVKLVQNYMKFQAAWHEKVRDLLDQEQKEAWNTRYRRTMHILPSGGF
ncbi:MAG: hypothetical protein ACODAJ_14310 [Planctomycetota bacterium]